MYSQETKLPGLSVTLTAHHDDRSGGLLMASFTADEATERVENPPLNIAVVIDRSGSMHGDRIEITRRAVARLIRSLPPEARIGVVVFDDHVEIMSEMAAPSEILARRVEAIETRGSTNLYGGWLAGAKMVGPGGRVILLSDGQANAGRYTSADALNHQANLSYVRFHVTTTTIGVGEGYDESVMAGMAQQGGGAHYFAHVEDAIMNAFSEERFSMGNVQIAQLSYRIGSETFQIGHLWSGETKRKVVAVSSLENMNASVRFTVASNGDRLTRPLEMPVSFGHSDDVTLEKLIEESADVAVLASEIRNPQMAQSVRDAVRRVMLAIMCHPLADSPVATTASATLGKIIERLEHLERDFNEFEASRHRKMSRQSRHNLMERAKAFSSFDDEVADVQALMQSAMVGGGYEMLHDITMEAFVLAPASQWLAWPAIPVAVTGTTLTVVVANPKNGFLLEEISRFTGYRTRSLMVPTSEEQIRSAIKMFLSSNGQTGS